MHISTSCANIYDSQMISVSLWLLSSTSCSFHLHQQYFQAFSAPQLFPLVIFSAFRLNHGALLWFWPVSNASGLWGCYKALCWGTANKSWGRSTSRKNPTGDRDVLNIILVHIITPPETPTTAATPRSQINTGHLFRFAPGVIDLFLFFLRDRFLSPVSY